MEFWRAFELGQGLQVGARALREAPLPLLVGGMIMALLTGSTGGGPVSPGGGGGGGSSGSAQPFPDPDELQRWFEAQVEGVNLAFLALAIGLLFFLVLCAGLLWSAFYAYMQVGWIRLHEQALVTGKPTLSTLFSGGPRFAAMLRYTILEGLISLSIWLVLGGPFMALGGWSVHAKSLPAAIAALLLTLLVPMIPWIWFRLSVSFAAHAVALDGEGARGALRRSFAMARGNRLNLLVWGFVMRIVTGLVSMIGFFACCVGVIVTIPAAKVLSDLPFTRGYLLMSRGEDEARRHALQP